MQRVLQRWSNDGSPDGLVTGLKKAADEVMACVAGEPFVLHPVEAVDKTALQLFESYSCFSFVLNCSHRMSKRLSRAQGAATAMEKYAGWTIWERMTHNVADMLACVRSMKDTVAAESMHQVHLFLQTALNLHAPIMHSGESRARANRAADLQEQMEAPRQNRKLLEMKVHFNKLRNLDGDRKAYTADHPDGFTCLAEVITKKNMSEAHFLEAALWNTIGGLNAEEMDIHLRPDQRHGEWKLCNAKFAQFLRPPRYHRFLFCQRTFAGR